MDNKSVTKNIKIDDYFTLTISIQDEELDQKIAVPTEIKQGKTTNYIWKNKVRKYTLFEYLFLNDEAFLSDLFNLIDFVTYLKSFCDNKLDIWEDMENKIRKIYLFDKDTCQYSLQIKQKDNKISLCLTTNKNDYYFSKVTAQSLVTKLNKIINKCDVI